MEDQAEGRKYSTAYWRSIQAIDGGGEGGGGYGEIDDLDVYRMHYSSNLPLSNASRSLIYRLVGTSDRLLHIRILGACLSREEVLYGRLLSYNGA